MKTIIAIGVVFCGFLVFFNLARAQTWTQTMAPASAWTNLACSADGTKLIAASLAGCIYTSPDSGVTWVSNNLPTAPWSGVASSADGTKLAAAIQFAAIYSTTNSSGSLSLSHGNAAAEFVSMSAIGSNLVCTTYNSGTVYVSTNVGLTFTQESLIASAEGFVSMSANAAIVVYASGQGVFVSTNAGITWFSCNCSAETRDAAVSASGNMIVAKTDAGVCISTNKGVSASRVFNGIPSFAISPSIAMSADGKKIFIVAGVVTNIYYSADSGKTWVTNGTPSAFNYIICSADGNKLAATDGSYIYTLDSPPSPQLILAGSKTNLNFSWIVPSTNMVLQESPDLMNWATVTNVPSLNYTNLQEQVTLPSGSGNGFFRLISQ